MSKEEVFQQHILVVEDDFINIFLIKKILNDFPNAHFARGGGELRNIMGTYDVKIILMDIELGMDNESGIDLFNWIRKYETYSKTKIYAITSTTSQQNEAYFKNLGFDGLFSKPLDKHEILESIHVNFGVKYLV